MSYLLDINFLIALAHRDHSEHARAAKWYSENMTASFYVCSVVEMGFVRVSVQAKLQPSISNAREMLAGLRGVMEFRTLSDSITAEDLPAYVTKPKEVTDGHLLALARRYSVKFATLDTEVPGAVLI